MLSRELQLGKAAEHIVCADLILQGHNAFLADQGLPYDVVVDCDGRGLARIQVKGSSQPVDARHGRVWQGYRFSLRRAKKGTRLIRRDEVDHIALVALDVRRVAYVPVGLLAAADGLHLIQAIWMRAVEGVPETLGLRITQGRMMRCMADYSTFAVRATA